MDTGVLQNCRGRPDYGYGIELGGRPDYGCAIEL